MPEFRSISQLADRVGAYCWVEHGLFAALGAWAGGPDVPPGLAVHWAVAARGHALAAEAWRDRLPVRAGVDRGALVTVPAGPLPGALERLRDAGPLDRLDVLNEVLLPRLHHDYAVGATHASPVSEGPVLAVLDRCGLEVSRELQGGRALWKTLSTQAPGSGDVSREIERMFAGASNVLPGEWAS